MLEEVYKENLYNITEPPKQKKIWNPNHSKLTLLLIEGRDLDILKYNLWNLAHVYGGTDARLHIICSSDNLESFQRYLHDWDNVIITVTDLLSDWGSYNDLLCTEPFYDLFDSEFVMICQWDVFLCRQVDDFYFNYDYTGAPWNHSYIHRPGVGTFVKCGKHCTCEGCIKNPNRKFPDILESDIVFRVGNGGFSLRNINRLKEFISLNGVKRKKGSPEDIFFCLSALTKPDPQDAYNFSLEHQISEYTLPECPIGCHQVWKSSFDDNYIQNIFDKFSYIYLKK